VSSNLIPSAIGPVAQGLEQSAHNRLVVGSIPTRPTIKILAFNINLINIKKVEKSFDIQKFFHTITKL
jgi:hypothetical protein